MSSATDAVRLYDAFARDYDARFEAASLRHVYDAVAWQQVAPHLPAAPATIVDVGCGTGRWVARCLALGHAVIGVEPAGGMQRILRDKFGGANFTLVPETVEDAVVPAHAADVVLAMGSLQYAVDPLRALRRMVGWLRPNGLLCVHVDGLVALTLELVRLGKTEEAFTRLDAGWGIFGYDDARAKLHLFDAQQLGGLLAAAGLSAVETRGLLVGPSAVGRAQCEDWIARDFAAYLALEERWSRYPSLADAGKHVMAWGRRPA